MFLGSITIKRLDLILEPDRAVAQVSLNSGVAEDQAT